MRKLDVVDTATQQGQPAPDGAMRLLHEGRDLVAWAIQEQSEGARGEWKTLSAESFLYVTRGELKLELRDRPEQGEVVLQAGECMVVPANVTFRWQRRPSDAGEPAVFLAVSSAGVEGSGRRVSRDLVQPIGPGDHDDIRRLLEERWGGTTIVTRARIHDATTLPGFVMREHGRLLGAITLSAEGADCEVVTLDSLDQGRGVGAVLLECAERYAREQGGERLWLVTTNDNLRAIGFYQRRGFRILAVHPDAVTRSRELKPSIPEHGQGGIRVVDEVELEKQL